ncbi:MAG: tRNA threonylcarbamoyladenosine dehydratase, partial [Bacteroidales bacterium]
MENWQERTGILLGEGGLEKLKNSSILVVGLGGVGAYAAEMLCRAGVGRIILLDSDTVNLTNKNRQLIALDSTIGMLKSEVLAGRMKDINPKIELKIISEYLEEENVDNLFKLAVENDDNVRHIDYVIDAIDTLAPKIALVKYCINNSIPLVSSMGAGAKLDATKITIADISKSYNCPLAYILRKKLRKEGIEKGFKVVFSTELPNRD